MSKYLKLTKADLIKSADPEQLPGVTDLKDLGSFCRALYATYTSPTGKQWIIKDRLGLGKVPREVLNEPGVITPEECIHSWKRYNGFTESYDYCEHCDRKRK